METGLAELADDLAIAVVDGESADALEPVRTYVTAESLAIEAGISKDSPRYSGMHQHCQYSRTC